jgi:hypothetical protein
MPDKHRRKLRAVYEALRPLHDELPPPAEPDAETMEALRREIEADDDDAASEEGEP